MALTPDPGLSQALIDWLRQTIPAMNADKAIPETIGTKAGLSTVIAELLSTATGKGASQIGVEDAGALLTATNVEDALAELATALAALATPAAPSTTLGVLMHAKASGGGGGDGSVDVTLPPGTYELVDYTLILRGAGTTNDSVRVKKNSTDYISGQILIGNLADNCMVPKDGAQYRLDDANMIFTGGTDIPRLEWTNGGGNDLPPVDVHWYFRRTA